MSNTITQTITEYTIIPITTMVLRPQIINLREQFRHQLNYQIHHSENHRLPYLNRINTTSSIDSETIIELNNNTSSERRLEFMESIISFENSNENRLFFIHHTSNQVRTYLHDLLIRSANHSNISENDLYRIGNIFLYTISNLDMDIDHILLRDVIQNIRETMVIYNTNQIFSILDHQITNYDNYLENVGLATEEQLQECVNDFNQQIERRIFFNRRRLLYTGIGILSSMFLTSVGFPPIGSFLFRSLTSSLTSSINSPSPSVEEAIRLRDIWDATLIKILNMINK